MLPHTTSFRANGHICQAVGDGDANRGLLTSRMSVPGGLVGKEEWLAVIAIWATLPTASTLAGQLICSSPRRCAGATRTSGTTVFKGLTYGSTHETRYEAEENRLYGNFTTLNFPERELAVGWQVRNVVETFMPSGPGVIKSIIVAEWQDRADNTKKLHAVINPRYNLMHDKELATMHWRHVAFLTEHNGSMYTQSEKLTVTNTFDVGTAQNMMVPPRT